MKQDEIEGDLQNFQQNKYQSSNTSMQPPVSTSSPEPRHPRNQDIDQDSFMLHHTHSEDQRTLEDEAFKRQEILILLEKLQIGIETHEQVSQLIRSSQNLDSGDKYLDIKTPTLLCILTLYSLPFQRSDDFKEKIEIQLERNKVIEDETK